MLCKADTAETGKKSLFNSKGLVNDWRRCYETIPADTNLCLHLSDPNNKHPADDWIWNQFGEVYLGVDPELVQKV